MKKSKYLLFLISVFAFLLLASRSSFLYVCNNWDDANSYFSVGKALFNGKMPYRDVFDQKGMYLYFFYGLAYLIKSTSFFGVFILEIVFGTIDVIGFYKILNLYISEKQSAFLAPAAYATIVVSRSFWWGGAAEEICLPFYIFGLYLILSYFRKEYQDSTMGADKLLIGGILAGFIANIKFTGLGFFFAWMALVWLSFVIKKEFVKSIKACLIFLFGMFLPFIPWIIYFGFQNSLYEWYWGYVFINVFLYPNSQDGGAFQKLYTFAKILYWLIRDNYQYFVFALAGIIFTVLERGQKIITRLIVPVLFGFLFLGIFIGGRTLPYYSLPLGVFSVFGFALIGRIIDRFSQNHELTSSFSNVAIYAIITVVFSAMIFDLSMNVPFMSEKEDSYFMFRFKDEVLEKENPTLLNIGCLDAGLYTITGIVPSCRWFQTQTLDIPEKENNPYFEQERYIKEGLTDFVLARDTYPECIYDNYELIDQADYSYSGYDFTYYLFQKNQ
ncbi:MAG: hypothetical protein E7302_09040 [Butyrivibrio sp.]|nr:hypothetical protein [Butyrivibrio sp.]